MSNLFSFLTDLAVNPKQQEAFANMPEAVMNTVGLSNSEQSLLQNGNSHRIAATFADEQFQAALVIGYPTPDPLPDPDPFSGKANQMSFAHQYA
ncbi:MAG: hypothetical protein DRR19_25085 [Candidatus Parabeggiatoa sp. nov. 1]|nr:MAG: hypothetical protein DRR19_25085 [Gammaproteobacteria bacterium]